MKLGLENLLQNHSDLLLGKRLGILAHLASCNQSGIHITELLQEDYNVTALFGPEHGLDGVAQDMETVNSSVDQGKNIPIYSLYGNSVASLSPSPEMLDKVDTLVIDLQDIGSRYYTYVWTTWLCVAACAAQNKTIIICDRPNPLGGLDVEGPAIEPGFESFVGLHNLPNRHGLTYGEIIKLVMKRKTLQADIHIIPMQGWDRNQHFPETGLSWINPSPNMRSYHATLLYPGMCLLEATNVSEGRGTDSPFDVIGAPFIRADELHEHMASLELLGISAESYQFTPKFQKWKNEICTGLKWNITDSKSFQPYLHGLALFWKLHQLYNVKGFSWRHEPYEFVKHIPAIDLLTGSEAFRKRISTRDFEEIRPLSQIDSGFLEERSAHLNY